MTDAGCDRVRELAPELALGIADGEERAEALEHLTRCADCRRFVDELSATADELLLLAPEREPPLGFEERVVDQIQPPRRGRRWGVATAAAAAAVAACAAALAVWVAGEDDRHIADEYRETLAIANGEYLAAAPLEGAGKREVGTMFGYQGEPSWCLVVVEPGERPLPSGTYDVQIVTAEGRRVPMGPLEVVDGAGSAGRSIDIDYHDIDQVRLLRGDREVAEADLG